jgi:YbgC/YbaW family acyl-CoA thioester hydrolase
VKRQDFRFLDRLRVRWAEVDMQRIVFNAHYLMYFDTAIAGYWRAMALPYHETLERLQGDLYVRKATLEYLGSARYDDLCDVGLRCQRIGTTSITFVAALFRGETCLVHGELVYVFADPATQSSRPVPGALRDALEAFERGDPMFTTRTGEWADLAALAAPLRHEVFVQEQGIDAAVERDELDADAVHAVLRNRLGVVLATGRLLLPVEGAESNEARIGRMAVHRDVRGSGLGTAVLAALSREAQRRGCTSLRLLAQASAVVFYRRLGFAPQGEPTVIVGIEHQAMVRRLDGEGAT